jgi:hypothetical protein
MFFCGGGALLLLLLPLLLLLLPLFNRAKRLLGSTPAACL